MQSDFANNEKFITLNIAATDGGRIYLPDDMVVYGVKINTPHYLAKLEELSPGDSTFTVIVSQLESLSAIHYTLRVCPYIMTSCQFCMSSCFSRFTPHVNSQSLRYTIPTITLKRFVVLTSCTLLDYIIMTSSIIIYTVLWD